MQTYLPSPKVFLSYDREAYAGTVIPDLRITFDTNMRWRDTELDLRSGNYGEPILKDDRILMELKLPGTSPLWLSHLLSENEVYPASFSKYGTCYSQYIATRIPSQQTKKEALVCA
jgi:hypothetical protein